MPQKLTKKEAIEQIEQLFAQAEKAKDKANSFVKKARRLAMRNRLSLPKRLKRRFCKHCYAYLKQENSRTRIHNGKVVILCKECKKFTRIQLRKGY